MSQKPDHQQAYSPTQGVGVKERPGKQDAYSQAYYEMNYRVVLGVFSKIAA